MTNTNNGQTSTWVVGSIGLLLVLLAGILGLAGATPATGGMILHTPLPLGNSLGSTVVNTPPAKQPQNVSLAVEPEIIIQNQTPTSFLFTGEFQAGQIVEAIGEEDGGVLFCVLCRCQFPFCDHE